MRIPLVDLRRHWSELREELLPRLGAVLESGDYILGEEVARFEAEFARFLGCRHVIGVASGTAALRQGLRA